MKSVREELKDINKLRPKEEKIKIKTAGGIIKVKNFGQQFYKSIKSKDDLTTFL